MPANDLLYNLRVFQSRGLGLKAAIRSDVQREYHVSQFETSEVRDQKSHSIFAALVARGSFSSETAFVMSIGIGIKTGAAAVSTPGL